RHNGAADSPRRAATGHVPKLPIGLHDRRAGNFSAIGGRFAMRYMPQSFHHKGARHITGLMATHAVGHRPQTEILAHQHGVLVGFTPAPDMGASDAFEPHAAFRPGPAGLGFIW